MSEFLKGGWTTIREAQNIVEAVYVPVTGFFNSREITSVLQHYRLPNGAVWPLPILLDIDRAEAEKFKHLSRVILTDPLGRERFLLTRLEVCRFDHHQLAKLFFGTDDANHPSVTQVLALKPFFSAVELKQLTRFENRLAIEHRPKPAPARA